MYALVDCNNFYVSCERVFNPSLKLRPVVVLSNNDGCIISRSQEAKELGIKMGEPYFKRKQWMTEQGVQVFSSNYALYGDMSRRVMEVLSTFTSKLEVYSIDEAFLGLHGLARHYDLAAYGKEIQQRVAQWVGVPVCVGIGPTKTLAKAANHLAKKQRVQTGGIWVIQNEQEREEALRSMPVKDVWGVGRKNAIKLEMNHVLTAWQLANTSTQWIRQQIGGVVGVRLVKELRGECCLQNVLSQEKRNIAYTQSFGQVVTCVKHLQEAIMVYTNRAAEKLRSQGSVAKSITVFAHTNRHSLGLQSYKSCTIALPVGSDSSLELAKTASAGIKKIFKPGIPYGKAGVILSDLTPKQGVQPDFFAKSTAVEHNRLMQTVDMLNRTWGSDTVTIAAAGQPQKQQWQMLCELRSPRYTTHISEILLVKS